MIQLIVYSLFIGLLLFIVLSLIKEYTRKRIPKKYPVISFIISSYNDAATLENTLKSITKVCPKEKREIIVIDDCSTDNTQEVLKKLKKELELTLFKNETNLGKVKSINQVAPKAKGEIICMIDSDLELNKRAIDEMIARLEQPKVGAVSCRYSPKGKGFMAKMVSLEYAMMSSIQTAYNPFSTVALWGGCMSVKKSAFIKVNYLTENAICEDMDLAVKIGEAGFRAEECCASVEAKVPLVINEWVRQRIRTHSGGMQNYLRHWKFFLTHPLCIVFNTVYALLTIIFVISFLQNVHISFEFYQYVLLFKDAGFNWIAAMNLAKIAKGMEPLKSVMLSLTYPLLSLHYSFLSEKNLKNEPYKLLWIFPFAIIYFPLLTGITVIGLLKGIYKYFKLKEHERGW